MHAPFDNRRVAMGHTTLKSLLQNMEPVTAVPPTPPAAADAPAAAEAAVTAGGAGGEVLHAPVSASLDTKFVEATRFCVAT